MKALVGAFSQEKALVGAFSVIVKADGLFAALFVTSRIELDQVWNSYWLGKLFQEVVLASTLQTVKWLIWGRAKFSLENVNLSVNPNFTLQLFPHQLKPEYPHCVPAAASRALQLWHWGISILIYTIFKEDTKKHSLILNSSLYNYTWNQSR